MFQDLSTTSLDPYWRVGKSKDSSRCEPCERYAMTTILANIDVRLIEKTDSFTTLTELLHRAYAQLAAMGFRYRATYQDVETTRERAGKGECYVAFQGARMVGTVLLVPPSARAPHCSWYDRDGVSIVSQFA